MNETFRKASSLIFTENEGLVDKHGHHLMPAMPIFQKHGFFEKGPKSQQFLKKIIFFCISCSIFIGLFNGPLFVFIMSMVGGTQKETLLLSHLNWPPLYRGAGTFPKLGGLLECQSMLSGKMLGGLIHRFY